MEKVIRDGMVAVLYSPDYGAGWYTWNSDVKECIFHPEIVKMVEENRQGEITDEFCQELFNCDYFYAGGASNLRIEWLPEGMGFYIDEYDGFETVETLDSINTRLLTA